ncbi:MAG TPA: TonB-dependent receptor, partial [Pyrinomonadaceae bacterium]|nr:TonB-dependent receptor [Pyrinomonadaceae bacterium]
MRLLLSLLCSLAFIFVPARAAQGTRTLSGLVITQQGEALPGVEIRVSSTAGELVAESDGEGRFSLSVPGGALTLSLQGKGIAPLTRAFTSEEQTEEVVLTVELLVPVVHESVVITASSLDPGVERRSEEVYRSTLFSRDDQVFQTLNAGINAGQHEGGGKSLEIRRFGFNLDHGGVGGGLKVLVDDVQQNQGTQGHGQGYLGQLKSLTPELVAEADILNGPFSAQYGDFSGLGVVHIRLKEQLPDQLTLRLQAGSFDTFRTFLAYSPELKNADSFVAYEATRTDGPFLSPLRYKRDNLTASYTRHLGTGRALGLKLNAGRNDFFSSGQIPLDEVAAGRLDRFGFVDPDNGGRVKSGTLAVYYRQEHADASVFKVDGFLSRSLFDLFSNFTFFLEDEARGDEIQQHDSRLQEGANVQYLRPHKLFGGQALLTAGANFHASRINVGLYRSAARDPFETKTSARATVTNAAGYVQQAMTFLDGHLNVEAGLRYDYFRFSVGDRVEPQLSGTQSAARFQPKLGIAYTPSDRFPATFHFNYGRGINSQDARGVVRDPSGPKIATTDFYQFGTSHKLRRFSLSTDAFLIDRSNEQVYVPDDGSIEFAGPSRAYGYEVKASVQLTRFLSAEGGVTQVLNAFYRGTRPRVYVDSAPHTVANASLTLAGWRGFSGSLRYRHTSNYRLDGEDATIRASGLDVLELSLTKRLRRWLDFNLSVDNLTNKRYYETQNYFASRLRPGDPIVSRIHATPGYPFSMTAGLTFHFFGK